MKWISNNPVKFSLFICSGIAVLSFLFVYLFTRPAIVNGFNLSSQGNLGSAIGGLTAPVIGIVSSVLLFFALILQISANNIQSESKENQSTSTELQILFELERGVLEEIRSFSYETTQKKGEERWVESLIGFRALTKFVWDFKNLFPHTVKLIDRPEAKQISQLIDSYELIEKQIKSALIHDRYKKVFEQKILAYYDNYLRRNLTILNEDCKANPSVQDELTLKIDNFVQSRSS